MQRRVLDIPQAIANRSESITKKKNNIATMTRSIFFAVVVTISALVVFAEVESTTPPSTRCPTGFVEKLGHCYYLSNVTKDWYGAWQECEKLHSHLYSVDHHKENDIIVSTIKQLSDPAKPNWWTGGSDQHTKMGNWVWVGTLGPVLYQNFCMDDTPAEPSHCIALSSDCNYFWRRLPCTLNGLHFICERDINL